MVEVYDGMVTMVEWLVLCHLLSSMQLWYCFPQC